MTYFKIVKRINDELFSISKKLPKGYVTKYSTEVTKPINGSKFFVFLELECAKEYFYTISDDENCEIWACEVSNPVQAEYISYPSICDQYWDKTAECKITGFDWDGIQFDDYTAISGIFAPDGTYLVESVRLIERVHKC